MSRGHSLKKDSLMLQQITRLSQGWSHFYRLGHNIKRGEIQSIGKPASRKQSSARKPEAENLGPVVCTLPESCAITENLNNQRNNWRTSTLFEQEPRQRISLFPMERLRCAAAEYTGAETPAQVQMDESPLTGDGTEHRFNSSPQMYLLTRLQWQSSPACG